MVFNGNVPIWLQVAEMIKGDILTGKLSPGDKMPGGRDLAVQYTINPNTAARVYRELEQEGVCETRRGLGTFVTEDPEVIRQLREAMIRKTMEDFLQRLALIGVTREEAVRLLNSEEVNDHA